MPDYRRGAHTVFDLKYHVVWVTKYRYQVLHGEIAVRARDLIRQICQAREIVILKGHVSRDHMHLLVSARLGCRFRGWCNTSRGNRLCNCSGFSEPAQAVLGPTSLGARVLCRLVGHGDRRDD